MNKQKKLTLTFIALLVLAIVIGDCSAGEKVYAEQQGDGTDRLF